MLLFCYFSFIDTNNEVDSDSDDSLPGGIDDKTSGDLDDIDLKDVPKFTEDLENMMSGTKIVPKALPKPLPEGSASVNSNPQSRQHNSNKAIKRRHSGRDGMFSIFFIFESFFTHIINSSCIILSQMCRKVSILKVITYDEN